MQRRLVRGWRHVLFLTAMGRTGRDRRPDGGARSRPDQPGALQPRLRPELRHVLLRRDHRQQPGSPDRTRISSHDWMGPGHRPRYAERGHPGTGPGRQLTSTPRGEVPFRLPPGTPSAPPSPGPAPRPAPQPKAPWASTGPPTRPLARPLARRLTWRGATSRSHTLAAPTPVTTSLYAGVLRRRLNYGLATTF